jgi:hypothetical protein
MNASGGITSVQLCRHDAGSAVLAWVFCNGAAVAFDARELAWLVPALERLQGELHSVPAPAIGILFRIDAATNRVAKEPQRAAPVGAGGIRNAVVAGVSDSAAGWWT